MNEVLMVSGLVVSLILGPTSLFFALLALVEVKALKNSSKEIQYVPVDEYKGLQELAGGDEGEEIIFEPEETIREQFKGLFNPLDEPPEDLQ